MVEIVKRQEKNRPLTICRITPSGAKRYAGYLETLEQVVRDAARVTGALAKHDQNAPAPAPGFKPARA